MINKLFWIALAALSLQDLFKKQSAPTKRQQQFIQTGETAQSFIEGYGKFTKDEVLISKIESIKLGLEKQLQKKEQVVDLLYSNYDRKKTNKYWFAAESMYESKKKLMDSIYKAEKVIEWLNDQE
ncbi:hypothetical protein EBZ38_05365 [bacterium]|nr:hypothetical protein [bacterium]NDD83699.1 hypothetical protein [bacterium]